MTAVLEPPAETVAELHERCNPAAERIALGSMLLNADAIFDVEEHIRTPDMFSSQANRLVYLAIMKLYGEGKPTSEVAVAQHLADNGELGRVGGALYLSDLVNSVPLVANAGYHAKIVAGLYRLRRLDQAVKRGSALVAAASYDTADETTERVLDMLVDIDRTTDADDGPKPWAQIIPGLLDEIEARGKRTPEDVAAAAIPTGMADLDRLLGGGGKESQVVVVAGRPGSGKSLTAMGWAQHAAMRLRIPTAVFSLEMSTTELGCRWTAAGARVPLHVLDSGELDEGDWSRVSQFVADTADAPLYVDEGPTLTVGDIRARARRLKQRHDIRMIVVDYLQLVESARAENRQAAVAAMSRALKLLAKELRCLVVLVAQLNRGPEQRVDKRPEVSDLRESGSIEADADVVILMHLMEGPDNPRAGEADLIVGKHRGGPKDTITVAAQLHLARFVDMAIT